MRCETQTPLFILLILNYRIFSNFSLGSTHFEVHFSPSAQLAERRPACLLRLFTRQLKNNSKKSLQKH